MLRGFHAAASGMYAQQRRTELLTNNLANMNTPGFKADQSAIRAFPEMLLQRIGGKENNFNSRVVGELNTGAYMQEVLPRFVQGDLRQTDLHTDLALLDRTDQPVFFTVEQGDEVKYTRNGNFTLDLEGTLTTADGYPVLDVDGNRIVLAHDQFTVRQDGVIEVAGVEIAQLGLAVAENPEALIKEGSGLFRTENEEELPAAEEGTFSVSQGFLEGSNVDPAQAMTEMLAAYRAFEANQKVLQAYDKSMDKAANEIGRL